MYYMGQSVLPYLLLMIGIIVLLVVMVIVILGLSKRCKKCGKWWAAKYVGADIKHQYSEPDFSQPFGIEHHTAHTYKKKCKYCGHEWTTKQYQSHTTSSPFGHF